MCVDGQMGEKITPVCSQFTPCRKEAGNPVEADALVNLVY